MMPSKQVILCCPLLLLPSVFPSQDLFQWVSPSHQVVKVLELQTNTHIKFLWFKDWPKNPFHFTHRLESVELLESGELLFVIFLDASSILFFYLFINFEKMLLKCNKIFIYKLIYKVVLVLGVQQSNSLILFHCRLL